MPRCIFAAGLLLCSFVQRCSAAIAVATEPIVDIVQPIFGVPRIVTIFGVIRAIAQIVGALSQRVANNVRDPAPAPVAPDCCLSRNSAPEG